MENSKNKFLKNLERKEDSIWGNVYDYGKQKQEKLLREEYANNKKYGDYLSEIKGHHSIPVMDNEVKKFLNLIPKNGVILDIGGCWGWHWRNLNNISVVNLNRFLPMVEMTRFQDFFLTN